MSSLIILEVGNLGGLVAMIIITIIVICFLLSNMIAFIYKTIYEWDKTKKLTTREYWLAVLISMLICGLISRTICGGIF